MGLWFNLFNTIFEIGSDIFIVEIRKWRIGKLTYPRMQNLQGLDIEFERHIHLPPKPMLGAGVHYCAQIHPPGLQVFCWVMADS